GVLGPPGRGANSVARQLARWASSPAALRTSWCSSLPGGTGLSSPLPGVIVFVGAPAPGANSVARLLARWVSSPAASRTSWCSSLPGGTGLSSPLPGVIVFVGAPAPGANSVAIGLDGRVLLLHCGRAGARPSRDCTGSGWRSAGALHPGHRLICSSLSLIYRYRTWSYSKGVSREP